MPELWEVGSITPLFNQTIVEGPHRGLFTVTVNMQYDHQGAALTQERTWIYWHTQNVKKDDVQ